MSSVTPDEPSDADRPALSQPKPRASYLRTLVLCSVILTFLSLGATSLGAPSNRILETALCSKHYHDHDPDRFPPGANIPEEDCKTQQIQSDLAYLISTLTISTKLAELVIQLPMGILADRIGRRLALFLNIITAILYWSAPAIIGFGRRFIPFEFIYFAPAFILIGGGPHVANALLFATIADVVSEDKRTTAFSRLEACGIISLLISPTLGSALMSAYLFVPYIVSLSLFFLALIPVFLLEETSHLVPHASDAETEHLLSGSEHEEAEEEATSQSSGHRSIDVLKTVRGYLSQTRGHLAEALRIMISKRHVTIGLASVFINAISRGSINFLMQYISKRYHWKFAHAGYLFTVKAGISVLLFTLLIPGINSFLKRYTSLSPQRGSLRIAQFSTLLLTVGSLGIGLAPTIWLLMIGFVLFPLGGAFTISMKSFLSSALGEDHHGRLYSIVAAVETLGSLIGTPMFAAIFSKGLKLGGWALGVPYLASAALDVAAGLLLLFISASA